MVDLVLIPARAGSKGLKHKNLMKFRGKPLIEHTMIQCKNAQLKNCFVLVSSDSNKIENIAKFYGYHHNYKRPKMISNDNTNIVNTVNHAVKWVEKNHKIKINNIILLQPTSPIRKSSDIKKAHNIFLKEKINSLISVTPAIQSPNEIVKINNKNQISFFIKQEKAYRRQQQKDKAYFIDGSIYIASNKFLKKNNSFFNKNSYPFIINKKYSIDIDYIEDFIVAEKIFNL